MLEDETGDVVLTIQRLLYMCKDKKLSDIFGEEEIAIKDINLELHLKPNDLIEKSYITQKALFIAREAYKRALTLWKTFDPDTDNPAELDGEIIKLKLILNLKLFELGVLNFDAMHAKDKEQICCIH